MSLLTITLITCLVVGATLFLLPQLAVVALRVALRCVGWVIRKRTKTRRDFILSRVRADQENFLAQKKTASATGSAAAAAAAAAAEDEDWEKVDTSSEATGGSSTTSHKDDWAGVVGFFHPFCNAGGGGERVLWEAVRATQKRWPKAICAIYTGDHDVSKTAMLEKVENRFNIKLHAPTVVLLYLTTRKYVQSSMYPHMTLLGQSLGSLIVAYDAFSLLIPDIFVDTMGYAFAVAFCKLLFPSVPTGAYVHYPTISTDMLESLDDKSGNMGVNAGAGKGLKGLVKRKYWLAFARLYGWVGGHIDVVMCNSSWTSAHIRQLWGPARSGRTSHREQAVVFPPTAVSELESAITVDAESEKTRHPTILYIAQFRPEKNHSLILRAFARFVNEWRNKQSQHQSQSQSHDEFASSQQPHPKLILIGSVRHSSPDETHIYNLRLLAHELRIRDHTTFLCDASWPAVLSHLSTASIGVNAMWNEHFGICVVEYQAAGLISVVHDSGGPREDIVVDLGDGATGFRASTEDEFAAAFEAALALPEEEKVAMRLRARKSALRFTEEEFEQKWIENLGRLVDMDRN